MLQEVTAEIEKTAKAVVNEIHTALPGEIISFDGGMATVKPIGKYVTSDGVKLDYPTITEAPVIFPFCQSSGVGIAFPVKKGDSCIILVSEVELDAWRTGSDSLGSLKFDLSSAMVIPGLLEKSYEPMIRASSCNAVIIKAGGAEIMVNDGGCTIDTGSTVMELDDGGVHIDGSLTVTGDIKAGSVSLKNHTHVDSTGGDTQKPK